MQITEKIIISSVLILAILLIRALFRKKTSPILIYSLWLLSALRILAPGMITESPLSIMNTGLWKAGREAIVRESDRQSREYKERKYQEYLEKIRERQEQEKQERRPESNDLSDITLKTTETDAISSGEAQTHEIRLSFRYIPTLFGKAEFWAVRIGIIGMAVSAVIFLRQNIVLYGYLRRTRRKLRQVNVGKRKLNVFVTGNKLPSPCLFGLFPSIYIPERCIEEGTCGKEGGEADGNLYFILEHEMTHYRHGDFIWSFVRILCLIAAWYNPLVWIAASLSLRDGELACDSGCIKRLGKEKRIAYGEALLAMIIPAGEQRALLWHAAMMTSGGKFMKRRIEEIAENRKSGIRAVIAVTVLAVLCAAAVFTGTGAGEAEELRETEERTADTAGQEMVRPVRYLETGK